MSGPSALNLSEVGKTNCCHSEEEKQLIRENVRITNEVLQALLLREEVLRSDLARYSIALAPIKQLPRDVLYTIFELHCQNYLPTNFPFWSKPPQFTLSQVCSAWRRTMLDFRKLWSNIVVTPRWNRRCDKVLEVANVWLSRAKELPCSVEFKWIEHRTLWEQDWHVNIVKDFISRHKFKTLGVAFADHQLRDLLQLPDEKLSCIEDFRLQYVNHLNSNDQSKVDFHKLVNLTSFTLLPNPFFHELSMGQVPANIPQFYVFRWCRLRHIQLRVGVFAFSCLTILEKSSAVLETCLLIISNKGTSTRQFPYRTPIQCNRLQNLIVDVCSSNGVKALDPFLLSLRIPNLRSLTLGSRKYISVPIDPLTLNMMGCVHLEELIISNTASEIDVQVLLTCFRSLRRLELPTKIKFTMATMRELGAGSIGANLEILKIEDGDLDIVTLLHMIKTRLCNGKEAALFKTISLYCDTKDEDVRVEIDELMSEIEDLGVNIEVDYPDVSDESGSGYDDEYSDVDDYVCRASDLEVDDYY